MVSFVESGFGSGEERALQRQLTGLNARRLRPSVPEPDWRAALNREHAVRVLEREFIEKARAGVVRYAAEAPREPAEFVAWFEALERTGPGQRDPLFPYLAERASREEMCWFLTQEVAGEAG